MGEALNLALAKNKHTVFSASPQWFSIGDKRAWICELSQASRLEEFEISPCKVLPGVTYLKRLRYQGRRFTLYLFELNNAWFLFDGVYFRLRTSQRTVRKIVPPAPLAIHENGWLTMSSNSFSSSSASVRIPLRVSHHRLGSKSEYRAERTITFVWLPCMERWNTRRRRRE